MKRTIRFVAHLYPKAWRDRYAVEFDALLEEVPAGWRPLLDVVRGALGMHVKVWSFGKIVTATAIAGGLIGFGASMALPKQYASDAVIEIIPGFFGNAPATPQQVSDRVNDLVRAVLSRRLLAGLIDTLSLYRRQRSEVPSEDVIETMKKGIRIRFAGPSRDLNTSFVVQFRYSDPVIAQRVTQQLAGYFMDQNVRQAIVGGTPVTLMVIREAYLSHTALGDNPLEISATGLLMGILVGSVAVLWRRPAKVV